MKVASLVAPTERIVEKDRKRAFWPVGLIVPLLPLAGIGLAELTNTMALLYLAPALVFIFIPIQDIVLGVDNDNLAEDAMERIRNSRYYRVLVQLYVPIQYLSFAVAVWWWANNDLSLAAQLGLAWSVGISAGIAINAAHEMGHKTGRWQQWLARISLAQSAYGHFFVEHNRGHHRNVATPEDPASSRYGESFWAFLPRTVIMSLVSAWRLEANRLRGRGHSALHWRNKNLQSWAITVALFGGAIAYAGVGIVPFLMLQAFIGFWLLEVVNYLEHYGLMRQKLPTGRYEKCQPHHSWNSNFRVTNVFLYQLQRHSDHHANPTRPYQILRNFPGAPNLPAGYATMILIATVPPLWFKVMNPRVEAMYDGDLSKANLTPRAQKRLARQAA